MNDRWKAGLLQTWNNPACVVRVTGLEPARLWRWNLNPMRLPIPPYPQIFSWQWRVDSWQLRGSSITVHYQLSTGLLFQNEDGRNVFLRGGDGDGFDGPSVGQVLIHYTHIRCGQAQRAVCCNYFFHSNHLLSCFLCTGAPRDQAAKRLWIL